MSGASRIAAEQGTEAADGKSRPPQPDAYVHPGAVLVSAEAMAVMTILGSCVAVCVWDEKAGVGGVGHHVLPEGYGELPSSLRYGSVAVPELIRRIVALGGQPERLRAKLFGGASVSAVSRRGAGRLAEQNVEVARRLLGASAVPIVSEDVGGRRSRKLIFELSDGTAWVRRR
ncbi:MAG: chemotaxis protein CheD [Myxococcota bacterium]|nr:chemotaxis protein CheD [Myxococcota bacterium]